MDLSTFEDLKQLLSHEQQAAKGAWKSGGKIMNAIAIQQETAKRKILGTTIKLEQSRRTVAVKRSG